MAKPTCDHCCKKEADKMCDGCGYRACTSCMGKFERVSALFGWKRRCPKCGKTAGWSIL